MRLFLSGLCKMFITTHIRILATCCGAGLGSSGGSLVVEHLPGFISPWAPSLVPPQKKQSTSSQDSWKTAYHDSQEQEVPMLG